MNKFYLRSTELRAPYTPRSCKIIRKLTTSTRDDLALVEVEPPLSSDTYDTKKDLNRLILASKHSNETLLPITKLPIYVYICWVTNEDILFDENIPNSELKILDLGEVNDAST